MADGTTHVWAHGTAVQYNHKEADQQILDVNYTSNGFEIKTTSDSPLTSSIKVYLPIPTPAAISDALMSFKFLKFHFSTPEGAAITNLRLVRNNSVEFEMADLANDLPLRRNFLVDGMGWGPPTSTLTLVGEALCLEITIFFGNIDNPNEPVPNGGNNDPVIIAGAGVQLRHKKFEYE